MTDKPENPSAWQPIETAPDGVVVVGLRPLDATGCAPAFIGKRYDIRANALIEVWSGRWAVCTHWMPLPPPPADAMLAERGQ